MAAPIGLPTKLRFIETANALPNHNGSVARSAKREHRHGHRAARDPDDGDQRDEHDLVVIQREEARTPPPSSRTRSPAGAFPGSQSRNGR